MSSKVRPGRRNADRFRKKLKLKLKEFQPNRERGRKFRRADRDEPEHFY